MCDKSVQVNITEYMSVCDREHRRFCNSKQAKGQRDTALILRLVRQLYLLALQTEEQRKKKNHFRVASAKHPYRLISTLEWAESVYSNVQK